ncbi:hypothetical protein CsSME_00010197 [Camellia sinensis var. sinensis]
MANNNGRRGIRCATIVHYRECQRNNAVDDCNRFLNIGMYEPYHPMTFYCTACGCHRSLHRVEEVQLDPAVIRALHWMRVASAVAKLHHHQRLQMRKTSITERWNKSR